MFTYQEFQQPGAACVGLEKHPAVGFSSHLTDKGGITGKGMLPHDLQQTFGPLFFDNSSQDTFVRHV